MTETKRTFATVNVPTEINARRIVDLLTGLYENNCSSWLHMAYVDPKLFPPGTTAADFSSGGRLNPEGDPRRATVPTYDGGTVVWLVDVPVTSVKERQHVYVDRAALLAGLLVMAEKYPRHFLDLVNENDDATTADVFGQCVIYGEEVYC